MSADTYDVARKLLYNERYTLWLTPEEGAVFVDASKNEATWRAYMRAAPGDTALSSGGAMGTLICGEETTASQRDRLLIRRDLRSDGGVQPGSPEKSAGNARSTLAFVAFFRIRQMVFEQLIPTLYPDRRDLCSAIVEPVAPAVPYAFPPLPAADIPPIQHTPIPEEPGGDVDGYSSDGGEGLLPALNLDVPIDDVYYSYEYDVDTLIPGPEERDRDATRSLSPESDYYKEEEVADVAKDVHSSLKYLFLLVNKGADPGRVEDVKKLLDEVRPSRSKWASDNIGQEELYLACEKALNDLKGYAGHSFPFLTPVLKREVPDYYDVIKNPMDLGTMAAKLEAHQYLSKRDFADDLTLIWNNCMQYNSHPPENPYRKHAGAMKRKSSDLLKKIPDITIVKVVQEPESEDEEGTEHLAKESNGASFDRTTPGVPQVSHPPNGIHVPPDPSPDADETERAEAQNEDDEIVFLDSTAANPTAGTVAAAEKIREAREESSLQERKSRDVAASFARERHARQSENLKRKFEDCPAIIATSHSLGASVDDEQEYMKRNKKRRMDFNESKSSTPLKRKRDEYADESDYRHVFEESYFPEIKYPAGCVPRLPQPKFTLGNREIDPALLFEDPEGKLTHQPSLSDYPEMFPKHKGALENQVNANIRELQRVKDIHARIVAHEANQPEEPDRKLPVPYQPPKTDEPLPPLTMTAEAAADISKQAVAKMLLHAGFDGKLFPKPGTLCALKELSSLMRLPEFPVASESALATLTDTFTDYFANLGKTIRVFTDKFSKVMTDEEILQHTLEENGIEKPAQLDAHIRVDIGRHGDRLHHLRRKLSYAYKDMIKNEDDAGEIDIEEASDDIISGNFYGDLDLLNLREMGIDGVTGVPRELWNKKADRLRPIRARVRRRNVHREEEPAAAEEATGKAATLPWRPVEPKKVIGLLRPFYAKKVAQRDMVEDEHKHPAPIFRSKVSLLSAKQGRKRAANGPAGGGQKSTEGAEEGGGTAAKKRKKGGGPDPAVKAQREAEKQRKAQEKIDRAKLREEQMKNRKSKGKKGAG
ncbi:Transcriptional activator spt7 [Thoreauomyces humboldtii]|nr:Transcriptional activator spt7 [Thoreauomyces humboldtii]